MLVYNAVITMSDFIFFLKSKNVHIECTHVNKTSASDTVLLKSIIKLSLDTEVDYG